MRINVKSITSAVNKISDLTSGDKTIPGVMLGLTKVDDEGNGSLKVAYSDGHKSLVEYLDCKFEDGDLESDVVVDYDRFKRAIANCQPSGIIAVDDIKFEYTQVVSSNVIRISADQLVERRNEDGEVVSKQTLATKTMDVLWEAPDANIKTSVLNRMKYDTIFEPDGVTDDYDREEFIDILQRTAVEKNKYIYFSAKAQSAFVANQAHLTVVPISKYDALSQEEQDELRGAMEEAGSFTPEAYLKAIADKVNRVHMSVVIPQNIAKALVGVIGKCGADKVSVHTKDKKFCNIMVEGDNEKVGIWFEMPMPSNIHLGTLKRYSSYEYKTYQIRFLREFLANSVKSAIESNKSDTTKVKFVATQNENATSPLDFVIEAKNAGASISDVYALNADEVVDATNTLEGQSFSISLKVFGDMLAQLKTDYVALDFNVDTANNNVTCMRLSEIDSEALAREYVEARVKTKELCEQQGIPFDENSTPTPVELKLAYRDKILRTIQYTTLSNK